MQLKCDYIGPCHQQDLYEMKHERYKVEIAPSGHTLCPFCRVDLSDLIDQIEDDETKEAAKLELLKGDRSEVSTH